MWKQLLKKFRPGAPTDVVASSDPGAPYHIYRVKLPDGFQDVVSLLRPDVTFSSGLHPSAIVGKFEKLVEGGEGFTEANFRPNTLFVELLHSVIATHTSDLPEFQAEAARQQTGWVYVIDARTSTPAGNVPAHDVIGGFEVRDGRVVAESYKRNVNHRLFSSDGLFRLDPRIHARLLERCSKESQSSLGEPT
jgi:hypothetical protein